jgi:hypothetical protein
MVMKFVGSTHEQRSVSAEIGTLTLKLRDGTVMQVSVNVGFIFAEVFELGARVAYAQAWSSSDKTSFGDNQLCPAGGMESDGVVRLVEVMQHLGASGDFLCAQSHLVTSDAPSF